GSSCISAEPAITLHTFLAGHPMLMSMICAPRSALYLAASAIIFGSAPAICTEIGSTSPSWLARRWVLALPYSSEFDVTISDTATPAPSFLHNWRNGRSVTPAIGATKRLLRKVKPANCMGVGIPGGGWKGNILPQPRPRRQRRGADGGRNRPFRVVSGS